jgi:signal transduction histidine kinase
MDGLRAVEGRLAQQDPGHLRRLARDLNGEGYRALGRKVRHLCQQRVDEAFVDEAWALACRELGDATPFERTVDETDGPLVVRMFRQDLIDVLVNVLRNAVQANEATGGGRVGVHVAVEDDWVTGLERVVIEVRDDSTLRLDTDQLRGRFLGRGLGLAVDRVTQAGGSMHVEEAEGWAKAVAIRLPRLEIDGDASPDWASGPVLASDEAGGTLG